MSELLRCRACGGAVVWDAAQSGAVCLFCGTASLELHMLSEPLPVPDELLPMTISPEQAERSFRAWASGSWFRPRGLAAVELGLRPMLLPAWRFDARLESHWAGLRPARTKSGKTPATGIAQADLVHMVPASAGLTRDELLDLQPFDEASARPWSSFEADAADLIWEPPALTRRGARAWARRGLAAAHERRIAAEHGLVRCRVDAVIEERDVRLLLVPIYIGVFRYRDRPWRFLINGQTGEVVGDAPLDRLAVGVVAVLVLAIVAMFIWLDTHG